MIRLLKYENTSSEIDIENNPISAEVLTRIFQILDSQVVVGEELVMELTDLNKEKKLYSIKNLNGFGIEENSKPLEFKSFKEFLVAKADINLETDTFKNRILDISNSNIEQIKSLITNISFDVSPTPETSSSNTVNIEDIKSKIEDSLPEDQKSKYKRLEELNSRVESIQSQIDFYQNEKKLKEELNSNIKKFSTEKETMSQMLQSVELLINNREELVSRLDLYGGLAHSPESILELKSKKVSYLNTKLFSNKNTVNSRMSDETEEKRESKFNFNVTVFFTILNLVITLIAFLYSYSINVLIFGLLFSFVLMVLYIISRFFKDSLEDIDPKDSKKIEIEEKAFAFDEPEDPNTQLFINFAWANALKSELQIIDTNIQKNLNGKTYEALKDEQVKNEEAAALEKQKLEDLNSKSLTSDEYYKKRRELDILKIERENLEFDLKIDPELSNQLKELTDSNKNLESKSEYIKKFKETFPIFLIGDLKKEIFSALKQDFLNQLVLVIAN